MRGWKKYILGRPLATKAQHNERLTNSQGLAIFASDALSSTAYATEEILIALAGSAVLGSFISIPIAIAISLLILIVSVSYRQVIFAYPQGGGVYNVARENLGELPSLVGASSLLIDYVLTAAVSVTAGVAAITSAVPWLFPHRIGIGIAVIVFLMWANLRGVRESGRIFSMPTYAFILVFLAMIGYGIFRYLSGTFPVAPAAAAVSHVSSAIGAVLLLHAFAAGCTAMTGIEATSNGIQAFKSPEAANAAKTLMRMALILSAVFLGITVMAYWGRIVPAAGETVVSQVARSLFGSSIPYFAVQGVTALILLLAANTPFADFPRVASRLAEDDYLPKQFHALGARLVFANGIIILSAAAVFLIYVFNGDVHALIPLYAVGVFLGFSLSQLGMVVHWLKKGEGQQKHVFINALGCVAASAVFLIVLYSKFLHGAWILVPSIVLLILMMKGIKTHYLSLGRLLEIKDRHQDRIMLEKTMIVLIPDVNRAALRAVQFAKSFQPAHLRVFHVAFDAKDAEKIQREWRHYVPDVAIDVVVSEYRDLIAPILNYLKNTEKLWRDDTIIVVMPEVIPQKFWQRFLHHQTALQIRLAVENDPDIDAEILDIPIKATKSF